MTQLKKAVSQPQFAEDFHHRGVERVTPKLALKPPQTSDILSALNGMIDA